MMHYWDDRQLQSRPLSQALWGKWVRRAGCEERSVRAKLAAKKSFGLLLPDHVLHPVPYFPRVSKQVLATGVRVDAFRVLEPLASLAAIRMVGHATECMHATRLVRIGPDPKDY